MASTPSTRNSPEAQPINSPTKTDAKLKTLTSVMDISADSKQEKEVLTVGMVVYLVDTDDYSEAEKHRLLAVLSDSILKTQDQAEGPTANSSLRKRVVKKSPKEVGSPAKVRSLIQQGKATLEEFSNMIRNDPTLPLVPDEEWLRVCPEAEPLPDRILRCATLLAQTPVDANDATICIGENKAVQMVGLLFSMLTESNLQTLILRVKATRINATSTIAAARLAFQPSPIPLLDDMITTYKLILHHPANKTWQSPLLAYSRAKFYLHWEELVDSAPQQTELLTKWFSEGSDGQIRKRGSTNKSFLKIIAVSRAYDTAPNDPQFQAFSKQFSREVGHSKAYGHIDKCFWSGFWALLPEDYPISKIRDWTTSIDALFGLCSDNLDDFAHILRLASENLFTPFIEHTPAPLLLLDNEEMQSLFQRALAFLLSRLDEFVELNDEAASTSPADVARNQESQEHMDNDAEFGASQELPDTTDDILDEFDCQVSLSDTPKEVITTATSSAIRFRDLPESQEQAERLTTLYMQRFHDQDLLAGNSEVQVESKGKGGVMSDDEGDIRELYSKPSVGKRSSDSGLSRLRSKKVKAGYVGGIWVDFDDSED